MERKEKMKKELYAPKTWKNLDNHYLKALESEWYKILVDLEDLINVETYNFYQRHIASQYMFVA